MILSLELLRRYSQLSDRYIRDTGSPGAMDDPENIITLDVCAHSKFDHFGFCFVSTQVRASSSSPCSSCLDFCAA